MSFRPALSTTAALLLSASAVLAVPRAAGAAVDPLPAPSATQIEEMRVGEEVGYVFEIDLGAVPGATYVEELTGEMAALPLHASASPEEEAPPAEEPAEEVVPELVEDVVAEESMETVIVDEEAPPEGEPGADADGEPVEEAPATEEAGPEEGDSPAGSEELDGVSSEEPAEGSEGSDSYEGSPGSDNEEAPPAPEEEASALGEPEPTE